MKVKVTTALASLAVGVFAVAGCGSSNDNTSADTGSTDTGAAATPPAATTDTTAQTDTGAASGSSASGGGEDLKLSADPSGALKFDTTKLDAKAGKVTITMTNPASVPHAIAIEGNGVDQKGQTVQPGGGTSRVSLDLKPGTYTFYCPVDGHRAAGMQGTLTVR
jgi:plastocyanin